MIRSGIFLVAGLMVILFPDRVYKFQKSLNDKLPILRKRYNVKRDRKYYPQIGSVFIIISLLLFVFSITR